MGDRPHDGRTKFFFNMSKGNMLLGHARGKVGSLVFSRQNGQQITRTRAEVIRNPKTLSQYIQRIMLNTASQAYSNVQMIADHSFQGKAAGQESMSEFMKSNLKYMRERVASLTSGGTSVDAIYNFVPVGISGLYPGPWIISNGTLPKVACSIDAYSASHTAQAKVNVPYNTYQSWLDRFGLERGDQITFVTVERPVGGDQFFLNVARVILDPREEDGTEAALSEPFIVNNAINKPNSKNEGNFYDIAFDSNYIKFTFTNGDVASVGIIVSRKENDVWKRSKCQMVLNEQVAQLLDAYSLGAAVQASKGVTVDVINQLYLNNAGTGGVQSTDSGSSEEPTPAQPAFSNTVKLTVGGVESSQNISGGSVTVNGTLTKVEITGQNLNLAELKAGQEENPASAVAISTSAYNTKAIWEGECQTGNTLYVFKGDTLWFSVACVQSSGGLDEG